MKMKQLTVGIFSVALIFLLALSGCPDPDDNKDGGPNPEKVGTDEVVGKTYYMGDSFKTVFKANQTFEVSGWITVNEETWEEDWVVTSKGSYGYNSDAKTLTAVVTHVRGEDMQGKTIWLSKSQVQAYVDPEELALMFPSPTYKYAITQDGSLLGQEIIPNKGTDQLKGNTYTLSPMFDFGDATEYNFAASGNTYSYTEQGYDEDWEPIDIPITGTYYYDSNGKIVWLAPASKDGVTMAAYYTAYDVDEYFGNHTDDAVKKASVTNYTFASQRLIYDPATKKLSQPLPPGWGGL
jgi:hypothetical protein